MPVYRLCFVRGVRGGYSIVGYRKKVIPEWLVVHEGEVIDIWLSSDAVIRLARQYKASNHVGPFDISTAVGLLAMFDYEVTTLKLDSGD